MKLTEDQQSRLARQAERRVRRILKALDYDEPEVYHGQGHDVYVMLARDPRCRMKALDHSYKHIDCECLGPVTSDNLGHCWRLLAAMIEHTGACPPRSKWVMGIEFVRSVTGDWTDSDTAKEMEQQ